MGCWMLCEGYANHSLLTREEEVEYGRRSADGDEEAREALISGNLRLVMFIAIGKYKGYHGRLTLEDFVSEGVLGLIRAVDRFDPDKGKFSSYASWWIKFHIRKKVLEEETMIRLPISVGKYRMSLAAEMERHKSEHGHYPKASELAEVFPEMSEAKILALMETSSVPSLDVSILAGERDLMVSKVLDESAKSPSELAVESEKHDEVARIMGCLDEREKFIIKTRFGLGEGRIMTLDEVAEKIGVTRERVRQIQKVALEKMRKTFN